jgi:hypothetical protein
MKLPLRIAFRLVPHSGEMEAEIYVEGPEPPTPGNEMVGCRVVVDLPHRPHEKRERHVRIELTVLGDELILSRPSEFNAGG